MRSLISVLDGFWSAVLGVLVLTVATVATVATWFFELLLPGQR